jgi:hypothetical protein
MCFSLNFEAVYLSNHSESKEAPIMKVVAGSSPNNFVNLSAPKFCTVFELQMFKLGPFSKSQKPCMT